MTFMEVKGHQRSNMVNYVLWLPYLVKRIANASWEWWWPSRRSKVMRGHIWSTMCYGYHIWSKEPLMQAKNDDDLHWGRRSSVVKCGKLCYMASKLSQNNRWCKFRMMATFMEVEGQQRSNIVNNDLILVRRIADTSLGWCWPSRRPKVSRGHNNKQFSMANKLGQKSSWCKFRTVTFVEVRVNRGQIQ